MKKLVVMSRGQVAIIYAIIIVALAGAVALGTDVAVMYYNWLYTQHVTDAAALAGANYLAGYSFVGTPATGCSGESDAASEAACTYAANNGFSTSSVSISEPTGTTIQVVANQSQLPYYFGKALGLSTYSVSTTAVAEAGGPVGTITQGLFPVGLQCTSPCSPLNFLPGQPVSFGQKFVGGLAPGNWQWLDVSGGSGGGTPTLADAIQYGASASFSVGGTIHSEPGNKGSSGPVKNAVQSRLSSCPSIPDPCSGAGGNPTGIPANDPCLVTVPAVDFQGCSGNCTLTIEGFAMVYMEPTTSTSTNINGCFVNAVAANSVASSSAPNLGAQQVPILIR